MHTDVHPNKLNPHFTSADRTTREWHHFKGTTNGKFHFPTASTYIFFYMPSRFLIWDFAWLFVFIHLDRAVGALSYYRISSSVSRFMSLVNAQLQFRSTDEVLGRNRVQAKRVLTITEICLEVALTKKSSKCHYDQE